MAKRKETLRDLVEREGRATAMRQVNCRQLTDELAFVDESTWPNDYSSEFSMLSLFRKRYG